MMPNGRGVACSQVFVENVPTSIKVKQLVGAFEICSRIKKIIGNM